MNNPQPAEPELEISASDTTVEEIDQLTRQLLFELRELEVKSAELVKGSHAPDGTKSIGLVTIGSTAIAVLPTALPKVVDAIQALAPRGIYHTVKFRGKVGGQAIEFEGSAVDLNRVLTRLSSGTRKR